MRTARGVLGWLTFIFVLSTPIVAHAQLLPPANYYGSVTNASGAALKSGLHNIIKGLSVKRRRIGLICQDYQHNRNPYVDNPVWSTWMPCPCRS